MRTFSPPSTLNLITLSDFSLFISAEISILPPAPPISQSGTPVEFSSVNLMVGTLSEIWNIVCGLLVPIPSDPPVI